MQSVHISPLSDCLFDDITVASAMTFVVFFLNRSEGNLPIPSFPFIVDQNRTDLDPIYLVGTYHTPDSEWEVGMIFLSLNYLNPTCTQV